MVSEQSTLQPEFTENARRLLFAMDQEVEVAELMVANLAAVQSRYCDGQRLHYKNMEKLVKKMKTIMLHITPEPPPSDLVRTPWWISDLSTLADEVRDRTILVKINSLLHSWSDLEIGYLFSEIGKVDEVKYLPTESGFHSQVRFQNIYDSEWAYYYYNGRFVHQGCCEIELHRPEDVISWNNQRIGEVLFGIRDTLTVMNTACLVKESLIEGEMLNQTDESTQILARQEPNLVKESSDSTAHQVLDKMPSDLNHDLAAHQVLVEMSEPKEFHKLELSDELRTFATPWIVLVEDEVQTEEQYSTGIEPPLIMESGYWIDFSKDKLPPVHDFLFNTNYVGDSSTISRGVKHYYVEILTFDPGGNKLQHSDDAICLSNEIYESEAGKDKESAEIEKNEPDVVKDPLNLAARNVTRAFASPAFTYVFAALVAVVNTKPPRIGDLLLRRIVLQLIRAYKRNDKPQLVAAAKFIAHLVNQMVCHEPIALELLEILLAQPTDDSVEVVVGFVTECGAILQDLSPMGPSVRRLYVQGKEINGAGINSSFATMYAHWVASLTLAEFWITQIYGFVFDPGGEVAGVLCEKSSVDCDLSCYWCLSSAEWVQAAELVQVQVQAAATSTDIICQVPLPHLIEDKIVYIYETLSTQVGDMGLRSKWAYVDPVYFVALSGILDLIITSNIFIFDPDEACSRLICKDQHTHMLKIMSHMGFFYTGAMEFMILEDKDLLNKGELLQEYQY